MVSPHRAGISKLAKMNSESEEEWVMSDVEEENVAVVANKSKKKTTGAKKKAPGGATARRTSMERAQLASKFQKKTLLEQ